MHDSAEKRLPLGIERRIIAYLKTYGNTREGDLINYCVRHSGRSPERVKKIVDRMAIKGKLHRIVHNKLMPREVYITLEMPLPPEAIRESQIAKEDVERILKEAASLAENMTRER